MTLVCRFPHQGLETHHIDRGLIEMEITETVLVIVPPSVRIIERITSSGSRVLMTGTGYLSIKYITHLPVDRIKLIEVEQGLWYLP